MPARADLSGVRGVTVKVAADPKGLAGIANVDLVRPDGKVVFTGRLSAAWPLEARVVMPTKDGQLTAVLKAPGGAPQSLTLTINAGAASARFQ